MDASPHNNGAQSTAISNPSVENRPALHQHQLQKDILRGNLLENMADRAMYQLVAMGFTAVQAREALRRSATGDVLRVDRAVELLIREE
jgi:hypothetical protein